MASKRLKGSRSTRRHDVDCEEDHSGTAIRSSSLDKSGSGTVTMVLSTGIKSQTTFSVGDVVKYDPDLVPNDGRTDRLKKDMDKYIDELGTVISEFGCTINIRYKNLDKTLTNQYSAYFEKKNQFSIGQIIQMKNDDLTIEGVVKEFGKIPEDSEKIEGSIGEVTGVDEQDPSRVYVRFDSDKIYQWLDPRKALPSAWMDHLGSSQIKLYEEFLEVMGKVSDFMFKAVYEGDIRVAKLLYNRHGIDANLRNAEGLTLLHIACNQGHKDLVDWLINGVKLDVEEADKNGFRAIHYATIGANLDILKMLIESGAQLDSSNNSGKTALHIAVYDQLSNCIELLIQRRCDVNVQDSLGNTPLHHGVYFNTTPPEIIRILVDSGRIDFTLRNKKGHNVLHLAILKGNIVTIQLLMNKASEILLESKDEYGRTPFLIACSQRSYPTMDLLIKAGANLTAVDNEENDAIILAAIHLDLDDFPLTDSSPEISKMIEKEMLPSDPALYIIGYLMDKGIQWNSTNSAGMKASDVLLTKQYHPAVNALFNKFATRLQISARRASGQKDCCMGYADCTYLPTFQLFCPHQPLFCACSKCFLLHMEVAKCGCPEEDIASVSASSKLVEESLLVKSEKEDVNNNLMAVKLENGSPGGKRKADEDGDPIVPIKREKSSDE